MKKALAVLLTVCLLASMLTVGMVGLFANAAVNPGETRQMKIQSYTQFYQSFIKNNLVDGVPQLVKVGYEGDMPVYNEADIALQGTIYDPWGRSWATDPNEQTHRKLEKGEYITFKLEVDENATELYINDMYFSYDNCNFFGVQLSADGLNWKSIGDFANNTAALTSGWKWESMDVSWGRDQNNRDVMAAAPVVDGKKVVYLRLVSGFNNGARDGSACKPYNTDGKIVYNNFYVDAKVGDGVARQMKIMTYTEYWKQYGEAEYGMEDTTPVYSEAYLALQGITYDPWDRSWAEHPHEQTHRVLANGEYMTYKLAVDENATALYINEPYFSYTNSNWFNVQLSADGVNWKSIGDYGNSAAAVTNGWKWNGTDGVDCEYCNVGGGKAHPEGYTCDDIMDESWGRGNNNKSVLSQCSVVDGKKIVYLRIVSQWNQGQANGFAAKDGCDVCKAYEKKSGASDGRFIYNNFFIDVKVPQVESIAVTTAPKTTYDYNTDLDVSGGKVTVTYEGGATEEVDMTADMVTGFDKLVTGTQTLTVTYAGKTTTYDVTVNEKAITSIALASAPSKTTYNFGDALDVAGGKLTVTYSDNSTEEVEITAAMVSGYDANTVGEQTLTVTYGDKTVTYTVTVKEALLVETTTIELKVGMNTEYNDSLIVDNTEGSYNKDIFGNGDPYRVQDTEDDYVVYALDLNNFTTDIEYRHTWTYDMANGFTIELSKDGENFEVWGTHNVDGSGGSIAAGDYTWNDEAVTNVLADNPQKLIYIKLKGKMKFNNMGFDITTVTDPSQFKDVASATVTGEYKTQYMAGESLDVSGMILHVVYTDGTEEDIKVWNRMVTGFDSNTLGEQTLTVTSDNAVATVTIKVGEFSGVKTEQFYYQMDGLFGLEIFEGEDLANRQKQFEETTFTWESVLEKRPNTVKISEAAVDYLLAYSFFPFAGSGNLSEPYLNIEGDGWITFEVDLNDRAVSFFFSGWSDFASCNFYASKDGGETWYLVADIGEKATGLGGSIAEAIQSPELCAANIEKVLTGNPEKKFLLKINPTTYGKALICNLSVNTVYNEGAAEDLPLVDETLEAEKAAGAAVDALILAIGDVEYTDESKAKIDAARAAYDALNDMEKPHVKELWTLEDAEDTYESLAKKAANQAKADEVMALIDAIGEVDYTIECRDAIIAALDAYDALTGAQKQMVENKSVLDAAQLLYNELRDAADGAEPGHREDKPVESDPEVSDPEVSDPEVSDPESSTDDTQNPGTGVAIPVAMIGLAVISAGAVLSLKKRR